MKKFLPFLTLVFLVSLIAIATYNLNKKQNPSIGNEEYGVHFVATKIALPDFSLPNLLEEGKVFSKEDLKGKYSIINFFASWCTTCQAEHQILLRLQSEKIIDIYGVAWRDIPDNTKFYLTQSGNPFKKVGVDSGGLFSEISNLIAVPETWIVDKSGTVVMRFRGNLQDFSIDEIREFLAQNNSNK